MSKITEVEWRDCYYLYRAMHDGICPKCGHVAEHGEFEDHYGNMNCSSYECDFMMTALESEVILAHSEEILKKRLDTFKKVRSKITLDEV